MQKSMVHELNSLTHSTIFTSRPTSFKGYIDTDHMELRRSRIQNLPGYKKDDLSGKLNFIVVFQTIEIQRLNLELQTLRVKARDWQRQRLNYQNYQVQIRELTQRCHSYEMQRQGMDEQFDRMKQFCEKLYFQFEQYKSKYGQGEIGLRQKYQLERNRSEQLQTEIQRWRNRYNSLQISRTKELENVRMEFESKRKSTINRQVKQLTIKYENQLSLLTGDLKKARQLIQIKQGENSQMKDFVHTFQMRVNEVKQIQNKMEDYQNKFVMLSQENYRLNELLCWKTEEIERLRQSEKEIRRQYESSAKREEESQNLRMQIAIKAKAIQELEGMLSRTRQQSNKLSMSHQKSQEYQRLVDQFEIEIERLNNQIHDKINESNQLKNSNKIMENKLSTFNNSSQKEYAKYEEKITNFTRQQQRLTSQLKSRLIQNQQLKVMCNDYLQQIRKENSLAKENEDLKRQIGQYTSKVEEFKNKIRLLEQNISIMEQIQKKIHHQEFIRREMLMEREKLNSTIKTLNTQLQTANQQAVYARNELNRFANIELQLGEYKKKWSWMVKQLDRINGEIQIKSAELIKLKESLTSFTNSKTNYQTIEQHLTQNLQQMEQLILDLDLTRRENDKLQSNNMNLEMSTKKLQGQLMILGQEKEDMGRIILQKNSQSAQLRRQLQTIYKKYTQNKQLTQINQQLKKKIENITITNMELEKRIKNQIKKSDEYSVQIEQISVQLIQLRKEPKMSAKMVEQFTIIRKQSEEKDSLIFSLRKRIEKIEKILYSLKQRFIDEQRLGTSLRQSIQLVSNRMICVEELMALASKYSQELMKMHQQKWNLQRQTNIDVEMCQSYNIVKDDRHNYKASNETKPQIKNESICYNLRIREQKPQQSYTKSNLYTFSSLGQQKNKNIEYQYDTKIDKIQQQSQRSEPNSSRESMASSFINTLITKESNARFQQDRNIQFDNVRPSFGKNYSVERLRYISPSHQKSNSPKQRYQPMTYLTIESQIQNQPTQANQMVYSPVNRGLVLENAGIKRVTSYTHFNANSNQPFMKLHQQSIYQSRDSTPTVRTLQSTQSQNIANSTRNTSLQLGKPIKISIDPVRMTQYQSY